MFSDTTVNNLAAGSGTGKEVVIVVILDWCVDAGLGLDCVKRDGKRGTILKNEHMSNTCQRI